MKISEQSWHYKLIDFCNFNHPDNLCAYFWKTVGALLAVPGISFLMVAGAVAVSIPLWWWLTDEVMNVAIFVGSLEVLALLVLLYYVVKDRREYEVACGERPAPEPSLIGTWAHAQHRKICPLIDFISPTHKE